MMPSNLFRQRGVSLIEALVALAVMAFGILGVVGIQFTLRMNADVSKQRAEAVRMAQEVIEQRRAYAVLPTTAGQIAYADIVTRAAVTVGSSTTVNTTYSVTETVVDAQGAVPTDPRYRSLVVDVAWTDRTNSQQKVQLSTNVFGSEPELGGSLGVPADRSAVQLPGGGRNPVVPPSAVDNGDGTSTFTPPGATDRTWIFNNVTGVITIRICSPACLDTPALLLTGFIRFATGVVQPTPAQAEAPPSTASLLNVVVVVTTPASAGTQQCFEDLQSTYVQYYCAVPVTTSTPLRWSGQALIDDMSVKATTLGETSASLFRACRYTPLDTDTPPNGNVDHPFVYSNVTTALINQNFLIIPAGDGGSPGTAFSCPDDDISTPLNTNTWQHQPHS